MELLTRKARATARYTSQRRGSARARPRALVWLAQMVGLRSDPERNASHARPRVGPRVSTPTRPDQPTYLKKRIGVPMPCVSPLNTQVLAVLLRKATETGERHVATAAPQYNPLIAPARGLLVPGGLGNSSSTSTSDSEECKGGRRRITTQLGTVNS